MIRFAGPRGWWRRRAMQVCPQCGTHYGDAETACAKDGSVLVMIRLSQAIKVDPFIGRCIKDTYSIQSRLGAGGMGTVYKAVQKLLGRVVAIKVLPQQMADSEEAVLRFHREAKSASSLSHPNTIIIYDYGQEPDGLLYLAMEYVDGKPLTTLIREGNLTPRRIQRILEQIAGSLMEAHGRGMIHRDLKPDNVMITTRAGEEDFVKVLDFGLAKAVGKSAEDVTAVTTGNMVLGTPAYMSPEQIQNLPLTPASDQYALGCIVFEMVTGQVPFQGTTSLSVCMQHVNDAPPMMHDVYPSLPFHQQLEEVIHRSLSKEPTERFASVAELLEALSLHLASDEWRSGSAMLQLETPSTRTSAGKSKRSSERQSVAVEEARPRRRPLVPVLVAVIVLLLGAGAFFLLGDRLPGQAAAGKGGSGQAAVVTPEQEQLQRAGEQRRQQFEEALSEGRKLFQQERYARALELFERAHGLEMKNPEPYQWIGETHKRR
ncbi:MAG: serine/threonine protein kinase, partial [Deltaproteobacteria bacterium]|nr:serine/threonine protein kinase [Deltaproteobacteria bacterium]